VPGKYRCGGGDDTVIREIERHDLRHSTNLVCHAIDVHDIRGEFAYRTITTSLHLLPHGLPKCEHMN
jgi:hypothetical protein